MNDVYDIQLFSPEDVYFTRGQGGVFQGVVKGESYEELIVYRAFPFMYPSHYISIRDSKGTELGIVRDIDELSEESANELRTELQFRYFLPRVTRIESVRQKSDLWLWELQTHLGQLRMAMRNLHEHIQYTGGGRIILTDISGKRCEIMDWRKLDGHSRKQLADVF